MRGFHACVGAGDGDGRAQPRQETAGEQDQLLVRADAVDDGVAMPGQPGITIQPVDAPSKQVKPEMIARRPAKRAGDQDAFPLQLVRARQDAHRDVVDLAFQDGEDENRKVDPHDISSSNHLVIWLSFVN